MNPESKHHLFFWLNILSLLATAFCALLIGYFHFKHSHAHVFICLIFTVLFFKIAHFTNGLVVKQLPEFFKAEEKRLFGNHLH